MSLSAMGILRLAIIDKKMKNGTVTIRAKSTKNSIIYLTRVMIESIMYLNKTHVLY